MFEDRTTANIKAEALGSINPATGLSSLAGSYADGTIGPAARVVMQLYQALRAVPSMLFVDATSGKYIDLVGYCYFNIIRRTGTYAHCAVTLTGAPGTIVPQGAVFLTADGLRFRLEAQVTLPTEGTATGSLEAQEMGSAYNIPEGALVSMWVNIPGLTGYTNQEAAGGTDTESDQALLERIDERRKRPPTSGNGYHYRQWALSVPGVGEAKVTELKNGRGTVGITIVDSNYEPASPEIVAACQAYIDQERPIGATPTVIAATGTEISVTAQVVISPATSADTVKRELESRLAEYFRQLIDTRYGQIYYTPEEDTDWPVWFNRIAALLLTIDGVENYTTLTVNGGATDVILGADAIPQVGEVVVTV